ncbi:hypothetical protein [Providencia burhodogranariea]|uniref:Uncharacterized protein n=1 Tax=Providencia burhodogranariea DSM 19968 TaxID=1141662 RepID=K8WXG7_9GAMM|nr:hypothetical protein OOA_02452 [Providencia burhodogranariea DSM 19968]
MSESIFNYGSTAGYADINNGLSVNESNNNNIDIYFANKPDSVLTKEEVKQESRVATTKHRDPLSLIDTMISGYINSQTLKAEALATEISEKSKAVADINHLWGTLMTDNLGNVDPTKIDQKTDIYVNSPKIFSEIDSIIKNILGEPKGIDIITDKHQHNYDELQSANATMTAFSDTIQVDLDSSQQEFKNLMTSITSAQEEIRDIRRIVISFAER